MTHKTSTKSNQGDFSTRSHHVAKLAVPSNTPVDPLVQLQRTLGNQAFGNFIQAKLRINEPGDVYEQEADLVADEVMRMPDSEVSDISQAEENLQRECTVCASGNGICPQCAEEEREIRRKPLAEIISPMIQRQGDLLEEEEEELLQTKAAPGHTPEVTPQTAASISALQGGGQPLPESVRSFFEPRFGVDFSHVRVYDDAKAHKTAQAVHARAFTVGSDIVFGAGQYSPETADGRGLVAHELVHTFQQAAGNKAISKGQAVIQRQPQPEPEPPRFPNFPELFFALERDVGENLFNYGHHLYRIAALYPGRSDLLEEAFGRYALGTNVLESGFMFAGLERSAAEGLALGTGILFKGLTFVSEGELVIDYQFDIGSGLKVETSLNLVANPDDYTDIRNAEIGLGLVGHF